MSLNWDDLKVALAVYRSGSLTRAAEVLELDQSTCSRRLAALEASLGAILFLRSKTGLVATEHGEAAVTRAIEVERRMDRLTEELAKGGDGPTGVVRLVGSAWTLGRLAGGPARDLLAKHPRLELRFVACNPGGLTRPEASLALRFEAPPRESEFAVKLGDVPYAVYAAPDRDAGALDWVAFHDEDAARVAPTRAMERLRKQGERIRLRTNDWGALVAAVASGAGKGLLPMCAAEGRSDIARVGSGPPDLLRALHVHLHPDTVQTQRIQAVVRWLRERVEPVFGGTTG